MPKKNLENFLFFMGFVMTKIERDAIRARCEQATEGPWEVTQAFNWADPCNADAEFIAHARTDIPRLLAEIERLEKKIDGVTHDI